jgi:hypothetical protein
VARKKVTNPDYDLLFEHLRGYRDIVINKQHGGFGLSHGAQLAWLERSQIPYKLIDRDDRHSNQRYGPMIIVNGKHWYDKDIARDDPVLVNLVRELGPAANGEHARLKVVRIPADVDWQIEDYDGKEWISEQHRTWD